MPEKVRESSSTLSVILNSFQDPQQTKGVTQNTWRVKNKLPTNFAVGSVPLETPDTRPITPGTIDSHKRAGRSQQEIELCLTNNRLIVYTCERI
jgi:hypothetical protein